MMSNIQIIADELTDDPLTRECASMTNTMVGDWDDLEGATA